MTSLFTSLQRHWYIKNKVKNIKQQFTVLEKNILAYQHQLYPTQYPICTLQCAKSSLACGMSQK